MKNNDERIMLDINEWASEDIRRELPRFRNMNFEEHLQRRLAAKVVVPLWRRLVPIATACAILAAAIWAVVNFRQPSLQPASGRESIHTFFAEYSTLGRLQTALDASIHPARTIQLPETGEERLSRQEIAELFSAIMLWRDLRAAQIDEPGEPHTAPRELKQMIDRFFSITLKSIKEKT
ncbi:MAG: hypothetical protein MUP71_12060 [Candidatus Aminicenantes bacterium]|nr:hypothetical protein [Candidatus Aminicenantes bacterium]